MALEVIKNYKDDVNGDIIDVDLVDGDPTVVFEFEGNRYALHMGVKSRDALRRSLQKYIDVAHTATPEEDPVTAVLAQGRRNPARDSGPKKKSGPTGSGRSSEELADIRAWAKENNIVSANGNPVSEKGRIAGDILDAYDAAH